VARRHAHRPGHVIERKALAVALVDVAEDLGDQGLVSLLRSPTTSASRETATSKSVCWATTASQQPSEQRRALAPANARAGEVKYEFPDRRGPPVRLVRVFDAGIVDDFRRQPG
jgi:hypothetical protein